MILKHPQFKEVLKPVTEMVSETVFGCDCCKKEIHRNRDELTMLEVSFYYKKNNKQKHYCSWICLFKHLAKINLNNIEFISLPYVVPSSQSSIDGLTIKSFKKLAKQLAKINK